ncbi:MAG: alginate lyase family protein [Flavobacteriales bacterium]|nr:alginate lyase family protein [Flavobacteriales bacterium]
MKNIRGKIAHLLKFPPHIIVQKIWNRLWEIQHRKRHERELITTDIRSKPGHTIRLGRFKSSWLEKDDTALNSLNWLTDRYMEHRFDLLGSGWVRNSYTDEAPGLEQYRYDPRCGVVELDERGEWLNHVVLPVHIGFSRKIWQEIIRIKPDYQPIDWQRDVKSGYRWSGKNWFRNQRSGSDQSPGADIKMPWELSRLQHLNRMLYVAAHSNRREEIIREVVVQILDFIASNPIGMGANFNCPMDIGIRNANILVALDLARQLDVHQIINHEHISWISRYVKESSEHILTDIEYREGKTSNHYLGNVLGILFAGVYLHDSPRTSQYLAFGIQELKRSFDRQFFDDGSNFEGSTAYHRLSGEMMVYGFGLIGRLHLTELENLRSIEIKSWDCKSPLFRPDIDWVLKPDDVLQKLHRSAVFSRAITKPDRTIVQFGDNDSGRFMTFSAQGEMVVLDDAFERYNNWQERHLHPEMTEVFDENMLTQCAFISSVYGLLNAPLDNVDFIEYTLFKHMGTNVVKLNDLAEPSMPESFGSFSDFTQWPHSVTKEFILPEGSNTNVDVHLFPDFQLATLSGDQLFIALSGISNPNQHHSLSHVHNDKGAVELSIGRENILRDPGTYLYTPIPERRIEFRSVHAHNTILIENREQNEPLPGAMGLFNMHPKVSVEAMLATSTELKVELHYNGYKHVRVVNVSDGLVSITDWCTHPFSQNFNSLNWFSNGYGKRFQTS